MSTNTQNSVADGVNQNQGNNNNNNASHNSILYPPHSTSNSISHDDMMLSLSTRQLSIGGNSPNNQQTPKSPNNTGLATTTISQNNNNNSSNQFTIFNNNGNNNSTMTRTALDDLSMARRSDQNSHRNYDYSTEGQDDDVHNQHHHDHFKQLLGGSEDDDDVDVDGISELEAPYPSTIRNRARDHQQGQDNTTTTTTQISPLPRPTITYPEKLLQNSPPQHNEHQSDTESTISNYSYLSYATNGTFLSISNFKEKFIGNIHMAPSFIHMPYIFTGYRMNYNTWGDCLKSIFELHNETTAIHSHLLGFVIFLVLMVYRYNTILYHLIDQDPILLVCYILYFLGSAICMLFSATFHTVCCQNQEMHDKYYRADMSGVVGMIISQYLHPMILSFYCHQSGIGYVYALIAFIAGSLILIMQNIPMFLTDRWFAFRITCIIAYGGGAIIPFWHFAATSPPEHVSMLLGTMIGTLGIYAIGTATWIFKIPECIPWFRYRLDLGVSSHSLWHLSIIIASLYMERGFYQALLQVVEGRFCLATLQP